MGCGNCNRGKFLPKFADAIFVKTTFTYPSPQIFHDLSKEAYIHTRCFRALRRAAEATGLFPSCYHIPFELKKRDELGGCNWWLLINLDSRLPIWNRLRGQALFVTREDDVSEIKKV
jgi:hypothetical protein